MSTRLVLVLNAGSSSLKYQLIEPDSGEALADGIVEQIGEPSSPVADYPAALRVAFEKLSDQGIDLKTCGLTAAGHRVVHGGPVFYRPTVIDDEVIAKLKQLGLAHRNDASFMDAYGIPIGTRFTQIFSVQTNGATGQKRSCLIPRHRRYSIPPLVDHCQPDLAKAAND